MYSKPNPLVEALGYGPEDRLVVFHADDVGMCHGSNQAYLDLHEAGIVKTGSVMAPCPWAEDILSMAQENPELDLGVHLTLTCEYSSCRWGPINSVGNNSTLVDADGRFWRNLDNLSTTADVDAADREVRAQVDRVSAAGVDFTHMGASLIPQLSASYVTLGFENNVPLLISRQHLINDDRLEDLERLESMGMPLVDGFRITPVYSENPPRVPTADAYEAVLSNLPTGVTYFSLHPNAPGEIERISPQSAAWRIFEHEYFQSQRLRDFLGANNIRSIGYREIRAAMRSKMIS